MVAADHGAADSRVDKDAKTVAAGIVVSHICAGCLNAEGGELVPRDVVVCRLDTAKVVHADSDETQLVGRNDDIVRDARVDRASGQEPVHQARAEPVVGYLGVFGADDGDIEAEEAADVEPGDGHAPHRVPGRQDLAMLDRKRGKLDVAACHTNAGLRVTSGNASAEVAFGILGRFDDGIVSDQGDAVFLDQQLLAVGSSLDDDFIARRRGVDGVLDLLARANMYGSGFMVGY